MADGLDVIIVDDDPGVCQILEDIITRFYAWGKVLSFTDVDDAVSYCLNRDIGIAVFVIDVFIGAKSGFCFLDAIEGAFPSAHEDAIMITGYANNDVVDTCVASGINHLLEKPVKAYALQLGIRAVVEKYLKFAKKLMENPEFADTVASL
jgi:response regulator of citrate/malate metabolism